MIATTFKAADSITSVPLSTARATQRSPVRAALRDATHAVHMRMHGLEPFREILGSRLLIPEYLRLLQSLFLYHSAIAAAGAQFGWSGLSSGSGRLRLLQADIRSLGGSEIEHVVEWQPSHSAEVLGALYAAEGSMLGGRVIAGQLCYLFGSSPKGRSFFLGSSDNSANWRKLLAVLEVSCASANDVKFAASGALQSFELFEYCVMDCCPRN